MDHIIITQKRVKLGNTGRTKSLFCWQLGDKKVLYYRKSNDMKFITVRDIRTSPARIWKELPAEQEMIITNNGKPIALLTPIGDTNLEETLSAIRRARAIQSVKKMQQTSMRRGTSELSASEIQAEIDQTRTEHS